MLERLHVYVGGRRSADKYQMREYIRIVEAADADSRFQYHLSVEPNLIPGKSFADQTRTVSKGGQRGDALDGNGGIYTTHALIYWAAQLSYEIPASRFRDDFPHYIYLVFVRDAHAGSMWAAHQDLSPPQDVIVLAKLGETDPDPDGVPPDYGRMIWRAEQWIAQHGAEAIALYS